MDKDNNSTLEKPIKFQFLRWALNTEVLTPRCVLFYTKKKRVFFKQIQESERRSCRPYYSTGKQLRYLTDLEMTFNARSNGLKLLKTSKNVKIIKIGIDENHPVWRSLIRHIPKNIKTVSLSGSLPRTLTNIQGVYKGLKTCRTLTNLHKYLRFYGPRQEAEKKNWSEVEYKSLNKFISRLRDFQKLHCDEGDNEKAGLQKIMSQGGCPYITNLATDLSTKSLTDHDALNDQGQAGTIPPAFSFIGFPNLRHLRMRIVEEGPLFSVSMAQGFKTLPQLQELVIESSGKLRGRKNLFEALLHLSPLTSFSLSVSEMENDEDLMPIEFLDKQTHLVSLCLKFYGYLPLRKHYESLNEYIETLCQKLNQNCKLESLTLQANVWWLESLSKGLSQLGITNQLKHLFINAFEDLSISSSIPQNKVEGLCVFIRRQKSSLRALNIQISYIKEGEIIDNLVKAIGENTGLQYLKFKINAPPLTNPLKLLQDVPKEILQGFPLYKKTFIYLEDTLQRLSQLNTLHITLRPIVIPYDVPIVNSSIILNALPKLKNLRYLWLTLPFLEESIEIHPSQVSLLLEVKAYDFAIHSFNAQPRHFLQRIEKIENMLKSTEHYRKLRKYLTLEKREISW